MLTCADVIQELNRKNPVQPFWGPIENLSWQTLCRSVYLYSQSTRVRQMQIYWRLAMQKGTLYGTHRQQSVSFSKAHHLYARALAYIRCISYCRVLTWWSSLLLPWLCHLETVNNRRYISTSSSQSASISASSHWWCRIPRLKLVGQYWNATKMPHIGLDAFIRSHWLNGKYEQGDT